MTRCLFTLLLIGSFFILQGQTHTVSLGIYSGITSTYSWDQGVGIDPRYKTRYDVKLAPIGISYGMDFEGFGFVLTPGIVNTGQNFIVLNFVGGQEGVRKTNVQYLNLPIGFKIHIIDLSFFKVSFLMGGSAAFLLSGKETVSHNYTKLIFPTEVYPILPTDYIVEYDGVVSPQVNAYSMLAKKDFNTIQFFASAGFRSDWDVSDNWRVSFDFRLNYGVRDPRNENYLEKLEAYQTLYDIPGKRRDTHASLTIGIARFIEIDKKDKQKKAAKGSPKAYTPSSYPWPKPRTRKPK
ncbi:MAG: outer membrane beta-barrel protein [Cyclobacteriaceae bacterium]|nr:outer membrane beta-barrel protein [Cyclobacteriaceae bacterium]